MWLLKAKACTSSPKRRNLCAADNDGGQCRGQCTLIDHGNQCRCECVTDNNCECNLLILIDDNQCKREGTFIDSRDQCSEVFLFFWYIYWFYNRSKSTPTYALTAEVGVLLLIMEIIVGVCVHYWQCRMGISAEVSVLLLVILMYFSDFHSLTNLQVSLLSWLGKKERFNIPSRSLFES